MTRFGRHVIALLDHLEVSEAVIGGTSLGANVTLEAALLAPQRVRAMVVEKPVLENALIAAGALFIPLALSIGPVGCSASRCTRWCRFREHYSTEFEPRGSNSGSSRPK
jgi:pimeloyl-ACP methyl ester carboxylesterase